MFRCVPESFHAHNLNSDLYAWTLYLPGVPEVLISLNVISTLLELSFASMVSLEQRSKV